MISESMTHTPSCSASLTPSVAARGRLDHLAALEDTVSGGDTGAVRVHATATA